MKMFRITEIAIDTIRGSNKEAPDTLRTVRTRCNTLVTWDQVILREAVNQLMQDIYENTDEKAYAYGIRW